MDLDNVVDTIEEIQEDFKAVSSGITRHNELGFQLRDLCAEMKYIPTANLPPGLHRILSNRVTSSNAQKIQKELGGIHNKTHLNRF